MTTREQASLQDRWQAYQDLEHLRDHWYWRPGWRIGRSFYTWHLTFEDAPAVHDLADQLQAELELPGLDLVPRDGLHLTMQGIGFTDEIGDREVTAIVNAVADRCRHVAPFDLTLGPVDPDAEGVGLLVSPWEPVQHLRRSIRHAITSAVGEVSEPEAGFRPHVTLAYSASQTPTGPIRSRLAQLRHLPPATTAIRSIQLIELNRDDKVYRWNVTTTVRLGGA